MTVFVLLAVVLLCSVSGHVRIIQNDDEALDQLTYTIPALATPDSGRYLRCQKITLLSTGGVCVFEEGLTFAWKTEIYLIVENTTEEQSEHHHNQVRVISYKRMPRSELQKDEEKNPSQRASRCVNFLNLTSESTQEHPKSMSSSLENTNKDVQKHRVKTEDDVCKFPLVSVKQETHYTLWMRLIEMISYRIAYNRETRAVLNLYHGIKISERTLKRNLQTLGLRRRSNCDDYDTIVRAIQNELDGSGSCLGYRAITIRLRNTHGLNVARRVVMAILRILDPGRVEERRKRRFSRRQYCSKGPNYLVHIDGYDKLKPFGFAIHGAICGYSRRILWLRVGRSNNDPYVTAYYFINFVEQIGGVPRCIRMDRGTENVFIEDIQKAFRWDHMDDMAGEKSVIYGSSHRNQRIERWWLTLRQSGGNFWMNLFKDMESLGLLSSDKKLEVECLRFCFTELLQTELDTIADEWNQHRLTTSRSTDSSVSGKPDLLYFLPEQNDTVDYKTNVEPQDTQGIKQMCTKPRSSGCEADFENLCETILQCNDKHKPTTTQEATDLYLWLVSKLSQ